MGLLDSPCDGTSDVRSVEEKVGIKSVVKKVGIKSRVNYGSKNLHEGARHALVKMHVLYCSLPFTFAQ